MYLLIYLFIDLLILCTRQLRGDSNARAVGSKLVEHSE